MRPLHPRYRTKGTLGHKASKEICQPKLTDPALFGQEDQPSLRRSRTADMHGSGAEIQVSPPAHHRVIWRLVMCSLRVRARSRLCSSGHTGIPVPTWQFGGILRIPPGAVERPLWRRADE